MGQPRSLVIGDFKAGEFDVVLAESEFVGVKSDAVVTADV